LFTGVVEAPLLMDNPAPPVNAKVTPLFTDNPLLAPPVTFNTGLPEAAETVPREVPFTCTSATLAFTPSRLMVWPSAKYQSREVIGFVSIT